MVLWTPITIVDWTVAWEKNKGKYSVFSKQGTLLVISAFIIACLPNFTQVEGFLRNIFAIWCILFARCYKVLER